MLPGHILNPVSCIKLFLPANTLSKVVFPLPDGPIIATNYPGETFPDKLFKSFVSLLTSGLKVRFSQEIPLCISNGILD